VRHRRTDGRIFNFGTLVIAGAGNPEAPTFGISTHWGSVGR
jgi:hypothetical protein